MPPKPEKEEEAIKTSLSFLDIGKPEITIPILCTTYIAPLTTLLNPMPNFSLYLYGETGTLKTTCAKDGVLSHFGQFDSINNFSNFEDSANAIEKRSFILKDIPHVMDDLCPSIKRIDAQQKEQLAQRIIRSYSNRTGRGRLNPDTSEKGRYEPRGMPIITGEELVGMQSTLARLLIVEISEGDIDLNKLSAFQNKMYLLPHAMSSYIHYVRQLITEIQNIFPEKFRNLRDKASKEGIHRKLPEQVAFLQFALEAMLFWIVDKKVLAEAEGKELAERGWKVFIRLAEKQAHRIEREDPIKRFEEILQTLIAQGRVRIEDKNYPISKKSIGGENGDLIGYYDDDFVYMMPSALWHSLQRFCVSEGSYFPVERNTFYRLLKNRKLVVPRRDYTTSPEFIRGKTMRVLKFIGRDIFGNL